MSKQVLATVLVIVSATTLMGVAGDLTPGSGPDNIDSAMYTLEDVYNRLTSNVTATKQAFTNPAAGPSTTGHTLNEVYAAAIPTKVRKTGQTATIPIVTSGLPFADGSQQRGVALPVPRFTNNMNGTVTDNLTGLIWLQNASVSGACDWSTAMNRVAELNTSGEMDGNPAGDTSNGGTHQTDWRLPNINELQSLLTYQYAGPALSNDEGDGKWTSGSGSSFNGVLGTNYWSGSTVAAGVFYAWVVSLDHGIVENAFKLDAIHHVWPVRGGLQ
jgi:hypothetical protein